VNIIIYIVDDDATFSEVVVMYFNDLHGYSAVAFNSPLAALSRIISNPPDVLILDIMMPGMNGDELVERAREAGCQCPVIILTGLLTPEESQRNGYLIGNRTVVGKPVPLSVLKTLVYQAVGNKTLNTM